MIFTDDFKPEPYWWEARTSPAPVDGHIGMSADIVIVGAGVTGVEAARVLSGAGKHVLVLDSGKPGEGASSRNAGQIGRNFKHSYSGLKKQFGIETARSFFDELQSAYDAVRELGEADPEAFDWRQAGRVISALSPKLLDRLTTEYRLRADEIGERVEFLGRDEIRAEMNSDLYHGGIRLRFNGVVQPARYHEFLMQRALAAGAQIVPDTRVLHIDRVPAGFAVKTGRGTVACKQVLLATNGYCDAAVPAIRKRLLPIDAYMVATEELSQNLVRSVLPDLRTYHDNRRRSHFFSISPDGRRILMGGRTGIVGRSLKSIAADLHGDLVYLLPQLQGTRLSHVWHGRCAAPIDAFPRFGELEGMFYALGYSFSGMAMGPHLARKVAALMLGRHDEARSNFARPDFPVVPLLARTPLTMPVVTGYYGWADRPASLARRM